MHDLKESIRWWWVEGMKREERRSYVYGGPKLLLEGPLHLRHSDVTICNICTSNVVALFMCSTVVYTQRTIMRGIFPPPA